MQYWNCWLFGSSNLEALGRNSLIVVRASKEQEVWPSDPILRQAVSVKILDTTRVHIILESPTKSVKTPTFYRERG